ncbi:MAG: hypothetical protein WBP41_15180 [Saprospiraceae bacterium]
MKEPYFVSLVDTGSLIFTIRDDTHKYEFTFEGVIGPYMLVEEALRASNEIVTDPTGWTAIIINSDFIQLFNPASMDVYFANEILTHYVIGTWDNCLEILAGKEPVIRRYPIE